MKNIMKPTSLMVAVSLAALLSGPISAQDTQEDGNNEQTLLQLAREGHTAEAKGWIGHYTDVNASSTDGTTTLHWAVYYGDMGLAKALIFRGADVTARNEYNATPLSQAAIQGNAGMIKLLLDEGADPNERGADDQTPLMIVSRTNHLEVARALIEAGADVNHVESWRGQTALMWAAAQQKPEMVKLLLDHGADPDAQSTRTNFERQVTAEPRAKVLPTGALTPLLYAAREGCAECAAYLIEAGADVNKPDPDEVGPLLMATLNAHWDTVKVLIENGANVNDWDWWGRTPLYAAVDFNTVPRGGRPDQPSRDVTSSEDIINMLLEKGANTNFQLKKFPLFRALGPDRGADMILGIGATPLHRAARGADKFSVQKLLEHGANPDLPTMDDVSPLMAASGYRASSIDTRGRLRSEQQAFDITKLLLEQAPELDVNYQSNVGQTALHGAATQGYTSIVRLLVEHGADPAIEDNFGNTAYDIAMGRGGSFGRGSGGGQAHPETAAALQELMDGADS